MEYLAYLLTGAAYTLNVIGEKDLVYQTAFRKMLFGRLCEAFIQFAYRLIKTFYGNNSLKKLRCLADKSLIIAYSDRKMYSVLVVESAFVFPFKLCCVRVEQCFQRFL